MTEAKKYDTVKKKVKEIVEEYSEFQCQNTNPGVVFLKGEVSQEIKDYTQKVVRSIVSKNDALELIQHHKLEHLEYKNGRGIIGALAAIGGTLVDDFTYELLTYRQPDNWGTLRKVSTESIINMDKKLNQVTFNNINEFSKPLITPRGPDPVLYGVRGETPQSVYKAMEMIKNLEPIERWMLCKTNQGTDQHFSEPINISQLKAFNPAVVYGIVDSIPLTIKGGHVFFKLKDATGVVDCAAFEPTGTLREIVRKLRPKDEITTYSGVSLHKNECTLNLEKLIIHKVNPLKTSKKPRCPRCNGPTESMGRNQGLRCKKCGYKDHQMVEKTIEVKRDIVPGIYLPDKSAHRHLTKPLERYGREKNFILDL
jgi:tRNA(Ile2)-agmatinylcytidine synthase